jgi:hypothetical protein
MADSAGNHVTSDEMRITVDVNTHQIKSVEYLNPKTGKHERLPKIGDPHPDPENGKPIVAEPGTTTAALCAEIKWHHHNPNCITLTDSGGAQYQVCFP